MIRWLGDDLRVVWAARKDSGFSWIQSMTLSLKVGAEPLVRCLVARALAVVRAVGRAQA